MDQLPIWGGSDSQIYGLLVDAKSDRPDFCIIGLETMDGVGKAEIIRQLESILAILSA